MRTETTTETTSVSTKELSEDAIQAKIEKGHMRRLGHLENYFALLQRQELYANFTIGCKLNHTIGYDDLTVALRDIFMKNPILAQTMVPKTSLDYKVYYTSKEYLEKPCPEHDFMTIIEKLHVSDIVINEQEEFKDILDDINKQFKKDGYKITSELTQLISSICIPIYRPDRPNWRLLCLSKQGNLHKEFDNIVFISNHICADALTGINLFQDIVRFVNDNKVNAIHHVDHELIYDYSKDKYQFKNLPLPITDRVNYVPTIWSFILLMITMIFNNIFNYKSPAPLTVNINKDKPQNCYQETINFTPEEVEKIRIRVKEQNCTMTAFLQAVLFVTLKNHGIFDNRKYNEYSFDISIPNNTRKLIPDELADEQYKYGSNVGGLHYSYLIASFNESNFWSLARYYSGVLKNADYFIGLGSIMMDMVTQNKNIDSMIADSYLNKQRGGIILSNVGVIDTTEKKQDKLKIEDILFMQNLGVLNFSYSVNVCTTTECGMNICMSVVEGALKDRADFIEYCHELKAFIAKGTF